MKNRNGIMAIGVIVVLAILLLAGAGTMGFGGFGMMGPGMMGAYGGYGGMTLAPNASYGVGGYRAAGFGYNPLGAILSLVFWPLIIGGVVILVVWLVRNLGHASSSAGSGLDILKTRYAEGEITKEQFDSMRKDIQ